MTNEYKKLLVEYLTGLLNEEQPRPTDLSQYFNARGYEDYNGESFEDLVRELSGKNVVFNGILENDNYTSFIVYGSYQDSNGTNSKGFIYICDTADTYIHPGNFYLLNCRGIQWLGFDEESNRVYGITSNKANYQASEDNDTYFSYFNNLFLATNESFTPEQTYATKIWSNSSDNFMAQDVIKDPGGSNYLIIGTNYNSTNNIKVISLKINVGQENEVVAETIDSDYLLCSIRGWYVNNKPYFDLIALNNNINPIKFALISGTLDSYGYVNLNVDQAIDTPQTSYIHCEYQVVSASEVYFIYNAITNTKNECCVYKYNGTSIQTMYKTLNTPEETFTPIINIVRDYDGTLYLVRYFMEYDGDPQENIKVQYSQITNFTNNMNDLYEESVWKVRNEIGLMEKIEAYNTRTILKRNFNLMYALSISGYLRTNCGSSSGDIIGALSYTESEIIQNGYTGYSYVSRFALVPKFARLSQYLEQAIRFSRNFYNISINNNITTSSMEVPSNFLNNSNVQINYDVSVSDTQQRLVSSRKNWTKNKYEVVHVNFINTMGVIDEDTNTTYIQGANRINYATNTYGIVNYAQSKCVKYRVNYADNTTITGALNWQPINDTNKKVKFTIYVDKAIKNIDLISNDGSTIYMTINGIFTIGKFYTINQKVRVGDKPQEENLQYNGENVLYNNEQVKVYTQ